MGLGTISKGKFFSCLMAGILAAVPATAQPSRIQGRIGAGQTVKLGNHVHPRAQRAFDQGAVAADFAMDGLSLMLAPSAEQQAQLDAFLAAVQDPNSPNYRQWLTPEQFADRFGLSSGDLDQVIAWLQAEGFTIRTVAPSRNWVAFSGTASRISRTFGTEIHRFDVDGEPHFANISDPSVPAALGGVVGTIRGLHDFGMRAPRSNLTPAYTAASGNHYVAPADLATIYNLNGIATNGYDGSGQKLVVVGQSGIDLNDIRNFRSLFGLSAKDPQIVLVPGAPDPGVVSGDEVEADLDLEWAGAAARNASLIYVYSRNVMDALQYAVAQNLAPVIAMSYGSCETAGGASLRTVAQQANAQGITWIAASGDDGAAGCESATATVASHGLSVILPASIPEVTGVGGTGFVEGSGTYWGTNGTMLGSALAYIPETSWNDTTSRRLAASGGGASSIFSKPPWQAGPGVPADNARDVPDVAMLASPQHDGAILCSGGSCANGLGSTFSVVGGTSLSTPVFAGIVTLLNQYLVNTGTVAKAGLGNINPALYGLAQTSTDIFHDITTGNNAVPCRANSTNCTAGTMGYQAGPGYDLVTGLGSVSGGNLVTEWQNFHPAPPALSTVTITPTTVAGGASATVTVVLTSASPTNGISVGLQSNSAAFPVPSSITVPSGQFSASLQVQTTSVTAATPVTVTATYNSVTRTANASVVPVVLPALTSLTVTPSTVAGGANAMLTVTLSAPAPTAATGVTVGLSSNSSAFPVPASITVPPGRLTAGIVVQTTSVTASTPVVVTATYNATTKTANVTVTPVTLPALSSVAIDPGNIAGGASARLTVTLTAPAPTGGASVSLSSNATAFPVPAGVTVPAGRLAAILTVQTKAVTASTPVTVTATYNSITRTANATVAPVVLPTLNSVTITPATIPGGAQAVVTVTLGGPAPAGGATLSLSSNASAFPVPATVTVPSGRPGTIVNVQTRAVTASTPVTVTVTYNGSSKTANATLTPVVLPTLASISVNPASVNGGSGTVLTLTLTGPAPPGGASITLTSSNTAALRLSSPVMMPEGFTTGRLRISTSRVTAAATVTITAGYNNSTKTATLTVNPGATTH